MSNVHVYCTHQYQIHVQVCHLFIFIHVIDAVFTYLCGQRIWDRLPCILITGCGYPPLSVRALVKTLSDQFEIPILGLFDYNVCTSYSAVPPV